MPRVLGSMMLRPGFGYIDSTLSNKVAIHIPFVKSTENATEDTALLEMTENVMRVRVDDAIVSRVSVATAISDPNFATGTGWTDNDESAATSTVTGGVMSLKGTGFARAIRTQAVSVASGDQAKEHAVRIVVTQGPVTLRIGTADGLDNVFRESVLGKGTHSLAFTPNAGTIYIQFSAVRRYTAKLTSCTIEAAGTLQLPTPWNETDLFYLRWDQSADVIYVGSMFGVQHKIERRGVRAWSIVEYLPEDGPFRNMNTGSITLTASGTVGDITLTSSRPMFKPGHVGALFKIESSGQLVLETFTGSLQESEYVRVIGVSQEGAANSSRSLILNISGTWSGAIQLQRSVGEPGNWGDVAGYNYVSNTTNELYNDYLDNQIVYYRFVVKAGAWVSGTANVSISANSGSIKGIARVTGFTSETQVSAIAIKSLGSTAASQNWYESEWSAARGFPLSPALYEGRLFWAGSTKIIGSVSDAYESFDNEIEGDSAPINRSIGRGPVDNVYWMLPLQRLCFGTAGSEWTARSSSFDEPLTASNFNLKDPSTQGSANVPAVKVDTKGFFVQKSGDKLFQMIYNGDTTYDYESVSMMELAPEVGKPGIKRVAVQRQPDTRIHCVRADGKVAVLISQPAEEVLCWVEVETDGFVEDVFVLPGIAEDKLYYVVRRTVNGATVRYLEKWAMEFECIGGTVNKLMDSHVAFNRAPSAVITGLGHLEGREVIVWADGKAFDDEVYTVSGGEITLPEPVTAGSVGLYYEGPFKSAKLAYAAALSTALSQKKRLDHLGLIMANVHPKGIKYGKSFDSDDLEPLPEIINDIPVDPDAVMEDLDSGMFEFKGEWDVDSRLCLLAQAPYPVTMLAAIVGMKTNA